MLPGRYHRPAGHPPARADGPSALSAPDCGSASESRDQGTCNAKAPVRIDQAEASHPPGRRVPDDNPPRCSRQPGEPGTAIAESNSAVASCH